MASGIGLIGADGTGKTTLTNHLKKTYGDEINLISEVARDVIRRGYALGKDASIESYIALMQEQISAVLEMSGRAEPFISDRTLLDQYVYSRVNRKLAGPVVPDIVIGLHEQVWRMERRYFAHYLYLPVEFDIVDDGVRVTDSNYQKSIDAEFQALIGEQQLPHTVLCGSVEERVSQARAVIDDLFFVV